MQRARVNQVFVWEVGKFVLDANCTDCRNGLQVICYQNIEGHKSAFGFIQGWHIGGLNVGIINRIIQYAKMHAKISAKCASGVLREKEALVKL